MNCINDEQRTQIVGRLSGLGLSFAVSAIKANDIAEVVENQQAAVMEIKNLIDTISGYHMPFSYYKAVNRLLDALNNDLAYDGEARMPLGVLNAINAILDI